MSRNELAGAVPVAWIPREPPLAPVAVAGRGAAAKALARAALAEARPGLVGLAGGDVVVLLGPAESLPWADGCDWLGRDPDAAGVLLPTLLRPDVPLPLYARAVLARAPGPVAALPDLLVPLAAARPLDPERLRAWLSP